MPAALLDDAEHRRQAEAGARARRLGGEERLEQVALHLLAHADPGVADREQRVVAGRALAARGDVVLVELDGRCLDRHAATVGHRVARVGREVEDHPLELRAVGLDRRQAGAHPHADVDVVADDPPDHRLHAGDDLVEVEHARVQHLAAA
jgi:hypothetical protein